MFAEIVHLLQKVEGRDKLTKILIYLFKLIDASRTIYHKRPSFKMERIAIHFQRARQFMRLGKFISEYHLALELIRSNNIDQFGRLIQIILHAIFSFYWALDNLSLAASFGLIYIPQYQVSQTSMTIKFVGMTIAALFNIRSWIRLHHQQLKAKKLLKYLKGQQNLKTTQQILKLVYKQWRMFLLCIKIFADMFPTISKSAIAKRLLKIEVPRIVQSLGGLINGLVSCIIASY